MERSHQLAIFIMLAANCLVFEVICAEQVDLTVYVHEGSLNGTLLPEVQVTGKDAEGNSFEGLTNSNGAVSFSGQPGTWKFTFEKEGYNTLNLNYAVSNTQEAAAYLTKTAQSSDQVSLIIYVHEGDLNGTMLSGVKISGNDTEGNSFSGLTNSNGSTIISGKPGIWQFTFTKSGYQKLNLEYNVNKTEEGAVYLEKNN